MNIDLEKAKGEGFNLADIEILKNCEIKVDCSVCKKRNSQMDEGSVCCYCYNMQGRKDYFAPEQNELDNLFIGAPVMVTSTGREWSMSEWNGKKWPDNFKLRLPTVAESPRNVLLAKWLKRPEELKGLDVWCKSFDGAMYGIDGCTWEEIDALIILEDLKK